MPNLHTFSTVPAKKPPRTTFDSLSYEHTTTISEGQLIPVYFEEILPDDLFQLKDYLCLKNIPSSYRSVSGDAFLDISYYFVPRRLLWKHFEQFIGANATPDAYTSPTEYTEPMMAGTWTNYAGTVADNLGYPVGTNITIELNPFPLAGYAFIWNEFYRDENIQDENPVYKVLFEKANGSSVTASDFGTVGSGIFFGVGGSPMYAKVNRYHDLFSSCLPLPQKGNPITLPLGYSAPVQTNPSPSFIPTVGDGLGSEPLRLWTKNGTTAVSLNEGDILGVKVGGNEVGAGYAYSNDGNDSDVVFDKADASGIYGTNLIANLSQATAADINSLRLAFSAQAFLEALSRGGSRYTELLHQMWGITPKDARLQRPEFLGTIHHKIRQTAVPSTAGTRDANGDPLDTTSRATGSLGAYTANTNGGNMFVKHFDEHGYLYGLASIRVAHTYGDGAPKVLWKKDRFDYHNKFFDRMGEVPVKKGEIQYGQPGTFGFQEAWYENKFHCNCIRGAVGPSGPVDFRAFTYGDKYGGGNNAALNSTWIQEPRENIDQTLIGTSTVPQFLLSVYHEVRATRSLSINATPSTLGF